MAPTYKIAVIQLHPKPLAVEDNHSKAVEFIREAASQSCDLAVLPEYHLTSWVPDDPNFSKIAFTKQTPIGKLAIYSCYIYSKLKSSLTSRPPSNTTHLTQRQSPLLPIPKYLNAYCFLAAELNINIVPGTIVETHGTQLTNVAYFISNTGAILGQYQKKNLWHPERPHLTSSLHEPHVAFDTPLGKVGMLICWDLAFPEAFRELIAGGAKMIIIPTFWSLADCTEKGLAYNAQSEALFLESTLVSRCFENTCMVVFANAGGPKGGEKGSWAGLSQVAVPF
ncbi:putative nitrilase [Lachnellula subtilissima]|uniref:Putative nitrilase n=1 Tax=Lachnellula subtilissima TaxID=602034 RepID=A0A8H8U605_9HELO|nr:putative nitrilase [Lachnellula subtilissima]